MIKILKTIK